MMRRRPFLLAALAGSLSLAMPAVARAEGLQAARDFVSNLAGRTIDTLRAKGMPESQRLDAFRHLFVASVDMPTIGKLVLGRRWRTATADQRREFVALFQDVVLMTWSARFRDAADDDLRLDVTGARQDGTDVKVESLLRRNTQNPISLVWKLRPESGGYKVVDLMAAGTSMVLTYREEYASAINRHGGSLDALIDDMRRLAARLAQSQPVQSQPARAVPATAN